MMKKLFSFVLAPVFFFMIDAPIIVAAPSSHSQEAGPVDLNLKDFSSTTGFDFDFQPATSKWKNMVGIEQPATLEAQYTLKNTVKAVISAKQYCKMLPVHRRLFSRVRFS